MDKEKQIEQYLQNCVRSVGGRTYKWVSPAFLPLRAAVMSAFTTFESFARR